MPGPSAFLRPQRIFLVFGLLALLSGRTIGYDRITGAPFASRSEVMAKNGMAATSQPLATQVALEILRKGGNAIDAAIAANATLGLMEPTGCGIGGDLFAIVWDTESGKLHGLNASGRSPRSLTLGEFKKQGFQKVPSTGPLPVSVPGCVSGWFELHKKFGKLPMNEVLAPAIRYCEEGFPLSELIAHDWARGAEILKDEPGFSSVYLPGGKAPKKGEIFRNPALGQTLRTLAESGQDAFYKGEIAKTIAEFMAKNKGFLSSKDLANHKADWVEPVSTGYRGFAVWELPPPGQGIAALQILNVMKGIDLKKVGFGSADHIHYFVEAKKLAFEDRARFYADPSFVKVPVAGLISDAYAETRAKLIHPDKASKIYRPGNPALEKGDTIYLTVADKDRNMVSLIQSNYRGFGSGLCPDGLGFCLQNRGELFDLAEGRNNTYAPGKRPFHTIIPAFITKDGKPYVSFGVMGGATQPQGHAQIVMNLVDFNFNLQEAGDAPRILHSGSSEPTGERMTEGGYVHLEDGFSPETIRDLLRRGHRVGHGLGSFGGYQAIRYDADNDVYHGASESRKDGQAAGY